MTRSDALTVTPVAGCMPTLRSTYSFFPRRSTTKLTAAGVFDAMFSAILRRDSSMPCVARIASWAVSSARLELRWPSPARLSARSAIPFAVQLAQSIPAASQTRRTTVRESKNPASPGTAIGGVLNQ